MKDRTVKKQFVLCHWLLLISSGGFQICSGSGLACRNLSTPLYYLNCGLLEITFKCIDVSYEGYQHYASKICLEGILDCFVVTWWWNREQPKALCSLVKFIAGRQEPGSMPFWTAKRELHTCVTEGWYIAVVVCMSNCDLDSEKQITSLKKYTWFLGTITSSWVRCSPQILLWHARIR